MHCVSRLVGRARAEKYPDTKHLMRNIYRACDPRAGVGFRSMDKNDYAMAVRCCKLKGIGAAGFILASEKTGLAYAQIYE